jgi:hypothetical protein
MASHITLPRSPGVGKPSGSWRPLAAAERVRETLVLDS